MKILYHTCITVLVLTPLLVSCSAPHVESCRTLNGIAAGGYSVEIQRIPDIGKLDINKAVLSFSRKIEMPEDYKWSASCNSNYAPRNYGYVSVFYDLNASVWFSDAKYTSPNSKPSELPNKRGTWDTKVKILKIDPSQKSLRFWVHSREETCASPYEERIPDFKKRISFLSFRLYYNDRIYDAATLLRYEKGKMFIDENKVKRVQPTPETKDNFYPPFFMKKPGYILSTGLHEVQFSDLRLVLPGEVVKK